VSAAPRLLVLALGLWAPPRAVYAAPTVERPAVEFRWDAPAGCPDEAAVVAQLEALLGGPLAERRGERLTAIARVRQEPGGQWDLRLWTVSDDGTLQRSLRHDRCDMLARAGVLIAAMAIDPLAQERMLDGAEVGAVAAKAEPVAKYEPPPEPAVPEPVPVPIAEPPRPEVTVVSPPPPRARALRGALRVSGGVAFGDLPGVGATLRLTPALVWSRVRLELEAAYGPVRRARFDDRPDVGADLQLAAGALRACPLFRRNKLELAVCAGLEIGAMYGRGVGFALEADGRLLWAALHLMPALFVVLHPRAALFFAVEGQVALARPRFVVEGFGTVYRALPGGARGLLGVEVRFP
jgi:hypothetical protein